MRLPEPPARTPDVPVGEIVDETLDAPGRLYRVVRVQAAGHCADEAAQLRQQPAIEDVALGDWDLRQRGVEPVQAGVGDEERVTVPQRDEELLDRLLEHSVACTVVLADLRRGVEIPAHRVGPERVEQVVRVEDVAA